MFCRFKKTLEVTVSKIIPAGGAWQLTSEVVPYDPATLQFALSTGAGEATGVVLGHLIYNKMFNSETVSDEENLQLAGLYGTAAACSGTVWQPTVDLLQSLPYPFVVLGTGIVCGTSFYTGLRYTRWSSPKRALKYITNEPEDQLSDLQLSVAISGATGCFVLTGCVLTPTTPILDACVIAGMSTSSGFLVTQSILNTLPGRMWTDP